MKSTQEHDCGHGQEPRRHTNGHEVRRALNWIASDAISAHLRLHGNVKWKPAALVGLAILWVRSPRPGLVEAAKEAIATYPKLFDGHAAAVTTYQALTAALIHYTPPNCCRPRGRG